MGCDNQPSITDIEEGKGERSTTSKPKGEHPITSKPSGADDCGWNPGAYNLSGPHIQGDFHSYPQDLNYMPDSKFDGNLINVKTETSEFCRESELYPEVSTRGLDYGIDGSNSVPSNWLMKTDSMENMNFMPLTYKSSTCYPIKEHGAEAKSSTMSRIQMSGNFPSSECSTTSLPLVYNFGKSVTRNDINIGPLSFNNPQNVDGNFLTLGIGSGTEVRPNNNFSTREISSKLEKTSYDSHYSDSIVRQCAMNPVNLTQSMGRAGRIQNRELIGDSGFRLNSVPSHGLQTQQTNVQPNYLANRFNSEFGSSPLSLPFGSNMISTPKHGTHPGLMHFASQPMSGQQDCRRESSMKVSPECSRNHPSHRLNQSSISHTQLGRLIPLAGGGAQISAAVNSLQSFQPARSLTSTAASIRTEATKIGSFASSVHPVDTHNVHPVEEHGNYLFPEGNAFQNSKSGNSQSAAVGPFPKRLGLQSDDFVTAGTSRGPPQFHLASPRNLVRHSAPTGLPQFHLASPRNLVRHSAPTGPPQFHLASPHNPVRHSAPTGHPPFHLPSPCNPVRLSAPTGPPPSHLPSPRNPIRPSAPTGHPPFHLPSPRNPVRPSAPTAPPPFHLPSPRNQVRPSASTGQYQHGVAAESSKDFPRVDCFNVAKFDAKPQASPIVSQSSLKRKATKHPSTARLGQLKKAVSQHLASVKRQNIQITPRAVHNPPTPHVKWQGFDDERPEQNGEKCILCKRDLSFNPEGIVFQPTAPPPVAVLPCGHMFHDHCLHNITPQDQSANPPCIPCAIGET